MSHSSILLPCGHRAAYRDNDPGEGICASRCDYCDWRPGRSNSFTRREAARKRRLAKLEGEL